MTYRHTKLVEYLNTTLKTHLIFDFDETLCKLILPWDQCFNEIKKILYKANPDILKRYEYHEISLSELQNLYVIHSHGELKKQFIESLTYFETRFLSDVIPNEELIKFVKNNNRYTLYIWSSNTRSTILSSLTRCGIETSFNHIIGMEDVLLLKPEPNGFEKIYRESILKTQYLFLGDSSHDKRAAISAGIDFMHINYFHDA